MERLDKVYVNELKEKLKKELESGEAIIPMSEESFDLLFENDNEILFDKENDLEYLEKFDFNLIDLNKVESILYVFTNCEDKGLQYIQNSIDKVRSIARKDKELHINNEFFMVKNEGDEINKPKLRVIFTGKK